MNTGAQKVHSAQPVFSSLFALRTLYFLIRSAPPAFFCPVEMGMLARSTADKSKIKMLRFGPSVNFHEALKKKLPNYDK